MLSFRANALTFLNIKRFQITNSNEEKLLGIKFNSKLSFESHASNLCKKPSQKLHALTKTVNDMRFSQRKALMKTFGIRSLPTAN